MLLRELIQFIITWYGKNDPFQDSQTGVFCRNTKILTPPILTELIIIKLLVQKSNSIST